MNTEIPSSRRLRYAFLCLLAAFSCGALLYLSSADTSNTGALAFASQTELTHVIEQAPLAVGSVDCPIKIRCELTVNGMTLQLVGPALGVPAMQREDYQLNLSGADVSNDTSFIAWFEGRDMEMGRHLLEVQSLRFGSMGMESRVSGMVPICTIDRAMVWRLTVAVVVDQNPVHFVFDLPGVTP